MRCERLPTVMLRISLQNRLIDREKRFRSIFPTATSVRHRLLRPLQHRSPMANVRKFSTLDFRPKRKFSIRRRGRNDFYVVNFFDSDVRLSRQTQIFRFCVDDDQNGIRVVASNELVDRNVVAMQFRSGVVPPNDAFARYNRSSKNAEDSSWVLPFTLRNIVYMFSKYSWSRNQTSFSFSSSSNGTKTFLRQWAEAKERKTHGRSCWKCPKFDFSTSLKEGRRPAANCRLCPCGWNDRRRWARPTDERRPFRFYSARRRSPAVVLLLNLHSTGRRVVTAATWARWIFFTRLDSTRLDSTRDAIVAFSFRIETNQSDRR